MRDERGAVAVVVALLMVPVLGFAAISLDVAGLWWEKQQLRSGADAGALAIAQDCGKAGPACSAPAGTAQQMVTLNHPRSAATGTVTSLSAGRVTVRASATRTHVFAPVLGVDSTQVSAESTVAWGFPSGGRAVLPLAFSWCEWMQQTGGGLPSGSTPHTVYLTKTSGTVDCTGPSRNVVPGGFGWLTADSGTCSATTALGDVVMSDPGNSVPSGCSTTSVAALRSRNVLLPIFDSSAGTGSGARYHIFGYAAFIITGYDFGGQYSWNSPCNGNARCIRGYFAGFVDLTESFTYSPTAPALGAAVVDLIS
ncbi:Putative Flp pilus-assembly TadE/G-like [Friedmanniella luteola]|uniref:Putative Flp pilus-assembly TadE/G-like n=1 Tax=Friedmanniella luteola TaxID=546871 RepID=A0A1H1X9E7_9ACTN|nr:Tad domain-containing protein [Friedmanniella luteola]SDT05958.1 Putative Flp pilus-assembly TadE/G-like [Friedmanniella luteola]